MTIEPTRRNVIATATAAAMAAATLSSAARAQPASAAPKMEYAIKKLPFDPAKVKGLSEKLLVSHYENNYSGAVKRLNAITAQLAALDVAAAPVFVVNGLKREELIDANSMIIHELYFDSLAGEGEPAGSLAQAINRDFGSLARWKAEFAATGKALGGGLGWVLLSYSPHDKRLINTWAADHTMTLAGGRPILALDMYEHAYQMDYGAAAAKSRGRSAGPATTRRHGSNFARTRPPIASCLGFYQLWAQSGDKERWSPGRGFSMGNSLQNPTAWPQTATTSLRGLLVIVHTPPLA
jgi:Fe-Mn family superoxide dismutase